jgi:hypothetical protein
MNISPGICLPLGYQILQGFHYIPMGSFFEFSVLNIPKFFFTV